MQQGHGFVGRTAETPVQVRSGGKIQGLSGESYGEITAKGKAEVGAPALAAVVLLGVRFTFVGQILPPSAALIPACASETHKKNDGRHASGSFEIVPLFIAVMDFHYSTTI